MVSDQFHFL